MYTSMASIDKGYSHESLGEDPRIVSMMTEGANLTIQLGLAIKRSKTESELKAYADVRAEKFRDVHYILAGACHNPVEEVEAAGKILFDIFDKYGLKTIRESYDLQTAYVESLLLDFQYPQTVIQIPKIQNCAEAVNELDAAQVAFKHKYVEWKETRGEEDKEKTATEVKAELLVLLNMKLIPYLNSMRAFDPDIYEHFATTIEQIVAGVNQNVAMRANSNKEEVEQEVE